MQRFQIEIDAGRDDTTDVIALPVGNVEGGRRAEIDNNQRPDELGNGADTIDQPVGANLARPARQVLDAEIDAVIAISLAGTLLGLL